MTEETKSNVVPLLLGAVAAVALAVLIILFLPRPVPQSEPVPNLVDQTAPVAAPQTVATAPEAVDDPTPPAPAGAQFDTFRAEADGSIVIAGRAEPGQVVAVLLGGEEIARATADASGNFVALPMAGPSATPRTLSLVTDPDGTPVRSQTSYIVAPIAAPETVVAQIDPPAPTEQEQPQDPVETPVASDDPAPAAPAVPDLPEVDATPTEAPQIPAAPTVLQADASGVRVVQSGPSLAEPNVGLDAITYDPEGEVQLSGRATGDGAVQVYIDNEPVTTAPVTQGGDWRIDLPDIATGVYTLRVDEVDNAGTVVSRIETPFKREEAADVAAVLAEETADETFEVAVRTVQPGSTLWAIAEETLGNGIFYVQVYEANSDLIRDPDLIYPGQIFRMPQINE